MTKGAMGKTVAPFFCLGEGIKVLNVRAFRIFMREKWGYVRENV